MPEYFWTTLTCEALQCIFFPAGFLPALLLTACLSFAGSCSLLLGVNHWFTSCLSDHSSNFTNNWVLILCPSQVCVSPELNGRFCASLYLLIIQLNRTGTICQNCVTSRITDNYSLWAFWGFRWRNKSCVAEVPWGGSAAQGWKCIHAFLLGWKCLCTLPCSQFRTISAVGRWSLLGYSGKSC